ncbi:hypothetical protein CTAYLR_000171 [Chrysophaeum taylorii]|uniref:Uncharacterized protein n=1 Tax=Chrysophaeum taylorii TaxID=2483200 RepID=A0AAD7UHG1_9STRA|nr:hypothetical protein CTAYLR_000171 [Chrysophaeum taylorii]
MSAVEEGVRLDGGGGSEDCDSSSDEENAFWWQRGLIQAPRCVVKWDHVDEDRESKGIAEKGRKVTWSELFLDLILVTNIGKLGEAYQAGDLSLLEAVVLYRIIYACWWSTTQYAGRFFCDNLVDKYACTGLLMFLLCCAGLRIGGGYEFVATAQTVARAAAAYHAVMSVLYFRVVASLPSTRAHMVRHGVVPGVLEAVGNLVAARVSDPVWMLGALLFVGLFIPAFHGVGYNCFRIPKRDRVPVHVDHLIERRGCLRLILFGEVVTGCTITPARLGVTAILPVALAFLIVLNMKLLAFDVDVVPIKRHCYRVGGFFRPWIYLEAAFFFDVAMAVAGSCVRIVLTLMLVTQPHTWKRADDAHTLLCLCVATAIACLTLERLTHNLSHILGTDHWWTYWGTFRKQPYLSIRDPDPSARRIFHVQLLTHVAIILLCVTLAAYCNTIDSPYELTLVVAGLAAMTSIAVLVNLADEVAVVESRRDLP